MTTFFFDTFDSPVAEVVVAVDADGAVTHLDFVGRKTRDEYLARIDKLGETRRDAGACARVRSEVEEYFAGDRTTFEVPLAARGTPFQHEVWRALVEIPYGATTTYGELAQRLARPNASRAVGRANGTNPIALIVPCHRVIGADGTLTGYAGGLPIKRALLDFECGQRSFLPA